MIFVMMQTEPRHNAYTKFSGFCEKRMVPNDSDFMRLDAPEYRSGEARQGGIVLHLR
jgi:hypothetical protein